MDALREEFKALLRRSGWNQAAAARQLDLSPPSVSRYLSDTDTPSKQTIRLFKMLLADAPETPAALREEAAPYATENWRQRALAAEQELAELKARLSGLLSEPSSSNVQTAKKRVRAALQTLSPGQQAEAKALARKIRENKT